MIFDRNLSGHEITTKHREENHVSSLDLNKFHLENGG